MVPSNEELDRLDHLTQVLIARLTKLRENIAKLRKGGKCDANTLLNYLSVIVTTTTAFYDGLSAWVKDLRSEVSGDMVVESPSQASTPPTADILGEPGQVARRVNKTRSWILKALEQRDGPLTSAQLGKTLVKETAFNPGGKSESEMIAFCETCAQYLVRQGWVKTQMAGWVITKQGRERLKTIED